MAEEVAYCCSGAGGKVQVVAGYCDHQNVDEHDQRRDAGILAESVKVPFSASALLLLIATEMRFFNKDLFVTRLFQNNLEDALIGHRIPDVLEDFFNLLLQIFVLLQGHDTGRFPSLEIDVNIGSTAYRRIHRSGACN